MVALTETPQEAVHSCRIDDAIVEGRWPYVASRYRAKGISKHGRSCCQDSAADRTREFPLGTNGVEIRIWVGSGEGSGSIVLSSTQAVISASSLSGCESGISSSEHLLESMPRSCARRA